MFANNIMFVNQKRNMMLDFQATGMLRTRLGSEYEVFTQRRHVSVSIIRSRFQLGKIIKTPLSSSMGDTIEGFWKHHTEIRLDHFR